MRLEVFCEDRLGLTRELLDLLVLRSIDLRGIEIDPVGRIYLNFAEIEFNTFSSLMAEIRRIAGVTDVRTIPWMPSEREHLALSALLEAMPEPFLSLDLKNKVERVNQASCQLFAQTQEKLIGHHAGLPERGKCRAGAHRRGDHAALHGAHGTPVTESFQPGRRRIQPDYCGEPEDASCNRPGAQAGKSYGAAADYRGYRYGERSAGACCAHGQPACGKTVSGAELRLYS